MSGISLARCALDYQSEGIGGGRGHIQGAGEVGGSKDLELCVGLS